MEHHEQMRRDARDGQWKDGVKLPSHEDETC